MPIILNKKTLFYSILMSIIIGIVSIKYSYYSIILFLILILLIYLTRLSFKNISFCLSMILFFKTAFTSHLKIFYYISNILTLYFSIILLLNLFFIKTKYKIELLPILLITYNILSIFLGVVNNYNLKTIYIDIMQNSFFPIFYLISRNFIKTKEDVSDIFKSIIYSALTGGIIFLWELITHYLSRDVSIYNYIFPIAIFILLYDKSFNKLFKILLVSFFLCVTILTQTRSAWLLMIVLIVLYLIDSKRYYSIIIGLFTTLLIMLFIIMFKSSNLFESGNQNIVYALINRFSSFKDITSSNSTLMFRVNSISFIFKQNILNIFFGSGLGSQNYIYLNSQIPTLYNQLEIAPFNYLWKYGFIGVILIYSIYLINIKNMIRNVFITKIYSQYEKIYFALLIPLLLIGSITGLLGFNGSVIMGILIGTNWNKINETKFNL